MMANEACKALGASHPCISDVRTVAGQSALQFMGEAALKVEARGNTESTAGRSDLLVGVTPGPLPPLQDENMDKRITEISPTRNAVILHAGEDGERRVSIECVDEEILPELKEEAKKILANIATPPLQDENMALPVKDLDRHKWYDAETYRPRSPGTFRAHIKGSPKEVFAEYTGEWWVKGERVEVTFWKMNDLAGC